MNQIITKTQIDAKWQELGACFAAMQSKITEAGALVCWLLDHDPEARDKFRRLGVTPSTYARLEKVGRGVLLPELAQYTRFDRLPLDQQRQVLEGCVTAVVEKADGTFDTIQVDVLRAAPDVAMRVIAGDHIRTPEEQRRMIERARKPVEKAADACTVPWKIVGNKIEFVKNAILTRADMLSALRALEG